MKFDQETPQKGEGSGLFIRLKDKESVIGLFQGEPRVFYARWNGKTYEECPRSEAGAGFRFKVNLLVNEGPGKWVAKIFEQGATVYETLKGVNAEYPLEETVIKITRSGSTKDDTSYSILPTKSQPTDEQMAAMKKIELNPLESKGKEPGFAPEPNFESSDEIPF